MKQDLVHIAGMPDFHSDKLLFGIVGDSRFPAGRCGRGNLRVWKAELRDTEQKKGVQWFSEHHGLHPSAALKTAWNECIHSFLDVI